MHTGACQEEPSAMAEATYVANLPRTASVVIGAPSQTEIVILTLRQAMPDIERWDARILATDIDTDMVAAVPAPVLEKIVAKIPVGRLGHAEEIARGVAFLCSEDAGFVTGSTMSINGGQHMY